MCFKMLILRYFNIKRFEEEYRKLVKDKNKIKIKKLCLYFLYLFQISQMYKYFIL